MEGDGDDRKAGLIVVKHMKNDGSGVVFAWCSGVGDCQILNSNRDKGDRLVKKDALVVGQWYSFRVVPHYKRDNQLVAFADEAVPIDEASCWPASVKRTSTSGRQIAQVRNVSVLVGAVQKAAGVAVGWSPFFQRVRLEQHLPLFNFDHLVKTGAMLSLTIAYTLVDEDCSWVAVAIEESLASNALQMQQMGVKKVIAEFATFDASKERCWATGENGERICFGACDFDRQLQQNAAVEFRPGDRFLAWIGEERSPTVAYHRAFYVQLLSSVPMPLTRAVKQQQIETGEVRRPMSISPAISGCPFNLLVAQSSSPPSNSAGSSAGQETTGHLTLNDRWAEVDKATDDSEQWQPKAVVSREQYLANGGRQLYARIIRQPDICRAICQNDPAILSDMFALFNP